jgi:hypothetical protein
MQFPNSDQAVLRLFNTNQRTGISVNLILLPNTYNYEQKKLFIPYRNINVRYYCLIFYLLANKKNLIIGEQCVVFCSA